VVKGKVVAQRVVMAEVTVITEGGEVLGVGAFYQHTLIVPGVPHPDDVNLLPKTESSLRQMPI
jgi:hypothetical protein